MQRVQGNPQVALLECVNPIRNKWRVRWDVKTDENGITSYMEEQLFYRPTENDIKSIIHGWINEQTNERILTEFCYEGVPVWLSTENQFNYKAAYDLAVQTAGASLPVTFKFGTDDEPRYRKFDSLESLTDFYTKALRHVHDMLQQGWNEKDNLDLKLYQVE